MFQLKVCPKSVCISTVGVRKDLFRRNPDLVPITDFFGSVRPVELIREVEKCETIIDVDIGEERIETGQNKTDKKPKKYRYVPPLVNFNTLIQ